MDTISADELTKEYGENLAVNRLSLSVGSEIYGLLGPNGSGKTVVVVAPIVLICTASMMEKSQAFNAMSSGDDVARTLGVDVDRFRRRSLITVSFSTSACIALHGNHRIHRPDVPAHMPHDYGQRSEISDSRLRIDGGAHPSDL